MFHVYQEMSVQMFMLIFSIYFLDGIRRHNNEETYHGIKAEREINEANHTVATR